MKNTKICVFIPENRCKHTRFLICGESIRVFCLEEIILSILGTARILSTRHAHQYLGWISFSLETIFALVICLLFKNLIQCLHLCIHMMLYKFDICFVVVVIFFLIKT